MTADVDETMRLYGLYLKGVRTPETRAANARYHRGIRMARRAVARARHRDDGHIFSPGRLRQAGMMLTLAVRDRRSDHVRVERLCRARAIISEEIDALAARLVAAGEKPYRIGLLLDEPPR